MPRRSRILLFASLAVASSLSVVAQKSPISEIWRSEGEPDVHLFASVSGMAEVAPGVVWVSDGRLDTVIEVTGAADSFRVVARSGEGPGEVDGASRISVNSAGRVAILSLGRDSVEVFDADLDFERRVFLDRSVTNPKGFLFLDDDRILLSGGTYGHSGALHLFSTDGAWVRSWGEVSATDNPRAGAMVAGGPVSHGPPGKILYSRAAPHRIQLLSLDGAASEQIVTQPDLLPTIGDDFINESMTDRGFVRSFRWHFPKSLFVQRISPTRILNVVAFNEDGFNLWQVFDSGGEMIREVRVERAYEVWARTRDGEYLVSYTDPNTEEIMIARVALAIDG